MAQTVSLLLSARDRAGSRDVIEDCRRPVKHVERAQVVLAAAERLPVLEIAKRVGVSRPMVWRWQQRYAEEGLDGVLRDKTRPPVPQAKVHAVVERTLRAPPRAITHWTGRAMAKAMNLSLRTIRGEASFGEVYAERLAGFLDARLSACNDKHLLTPRRRYERQQPPQIHHRPRPSLA